MRISDGNSKLGKIPNVSTVPVKDCGNADYCKRDCYALKALRQYKNVRTAWWENSEQFRKDPDGAFVELDAYLLRKKPRYFRIHVAGDFTSQDQVNRWKALAAMHPSTKFLAFTKMHDFNYERLPSNFTVVLSLWPGMELPKKRMPRAWLQDGTEKRIPANAIDCPGTCETCGMCWNLRELKRDVYFTKH